MEERKSDNSSLYRYIKISDAALRMGVSESTLRKYERQGVIDPTRVDDSNYRFYNYYELLRVRSCLEYRQYGCKVDAAVELMDRATLEALGAGLEEREAWMTREHARQGAILEDLRMRLKDMAECEQNHGLLRVENREERVYVTADMLTPAGKDPCLEKTIQELTSLGPLAHGCGRSSLGPDGEYVLNDSGNILLRRHAAEFGFEHGGFGTIVPAGQFVATYMTLAPYYRTYMNSEITQTMHTMQSFARERGGRPSNTFYYEIFARVGVGEELKSYGKFSLSMD